MLLVDTYIGVSAIHGIGLFAEKDIKKGDKIWKFHQRTTQIFWKKQFFNFCKQLPYSVIVDFINHSYLKDGNVYYLNDNSRFINHSLEPNIAFSDLNTEIAICDIKKGQEFTENYLMSYDMNDFFRWEEMRSIVNKEDLLNLLKERLFHPNLPQKGFHLNSA